MPRWKLAAIWMFFPIVLQGVPLLDSLGLESAQFFAVVIWFWVGLIPTVTTADAPWLKFGDSALNVMLLISFIAIGYGACALMNPGCDNRQGLLFLLLITCGAGLLATSLRQFCELLSPRRFRWYFLTFTVAELFVFLWQLAWDPSIMGHTWTIGWFAGSIYDPAIEVPSRLVWFRLRNLCLVVALVGVLDLRWRRSSHRSWRASALMLCGCIFFWVTLWSRSAQTGVHLSTNAVIEELGTTIESEHFLIHFSAASINSTEQQHLVEDAEFRYAQLHDFFQSDPVKWRGRKIEIFIYPSVSEQYRLMGSRHTLVARPWTHQMHIRWSYGNGALTHELAHLFTAPFGHPVTQLAHNGLLPSIGLVEGIAVAAEEEPSELSLHQLAAGIASTLGPIAISDLLSPQQFWALPAGRAYDSLGSFVRWLIETEGIEPFKKAYATGEFNTVYSRSLRNLEQEWQAFLNSVSLPEHMDEFVRRRYLRSTIFTQVCARVLAERQREASQLERAGNTDAAISRYQSILQLDSEHWITHNRILALQMRTGDQDAIRHSIEQLKSARLSPEAKHRLVEQELDFRWLKGEAVSAEYERLARSVLRDSRQRSLLVKSALSKQGEGPEYFLSELSPIARLLKAQSYEGQVGIYLSNYLRLYSGVLSESELDEISSVKLKQFREELFIQAAWVAWRDRSFEQWELLMAELKNASSPRVRGLAAELRERRQTLEKRRTSF